MAEQDQEDQDDLESEHDSNDAEYGLSGVRRPMNAFFIFCKRHRDIVREKYPHLENRSITKILGEWWANLDPSEKSSYTALAKQYKEAFMKANPDFKWYKIPTPPTRTLVTRPSNQRCLQTQKERKKSCGITLGKLADDTQLGGLSSLISPMTSIASSTANCHSNAIASSSSSAVSSTSHISPPNILKPPKKRYIINGEFRCQSESSLTTESRDHQTQNACSALLQLAGICANDEYQKLTTSPLDVSSKKDNSGEQHTVEYDSVVPPFGTSNSKNVAESTLNPPFPCDSEIQDDNHPISLKKQPAVVNSKVIVQNEQVQHEDQPLNLCKEKEKTFRASNQQLIDHLVDKFLCDSPSHSGNHFSSVLDPSFSHFLSPSKLHLNNLTPTKEKSLYTGFTLSDAIESAVDQAYSKDVVNANKMERAEELCDVQKAAPKCITEDVLRTGSILDSKGFSKTSPKRKEENSDTQSNEYDSKDVIEVPHSISLKFSFSNKTEDKTGPTNSFIPNKAETSGEEKSNNRLFCHRKKSRMWCDIFMNEQLKNSGNSDSHKKSLAGLSSPVRRNSQRTCKGRRYQALITEGLLQSSKERKPGGVRKPLPSPAERFKSKICPSDESSAILSTSKKKRKKEFSDKTKTYFKAETDLNKCMFDLEEKIAALPKCDIETLNKRKKPASDTADKDEVDYSKYSVSPTNSPTSTTSKESGVCDDSDSPEQLCLVNEYHGFNDSSYAKSSGRFKTGSFDLEHHIASLPKCDIEMLNKRKAKN